MSFLLNPTIYKVGLVVYTVIQYMEYLRRVRMVGTDAYNTYSFISHRVAPVSVSYNHKHPPSHQVCQSQASQYLEEKGNEKVEGIDQGESDANTVNIHLSSSYLFDQSYVETSNIETLKCSPHADKNQ